MEFLRHKTRARKSKSDVVSKKRSAPSRAHKEDDAFADAPTKEARRHRVDTWELGDRRQGANELDWSASHTWLLSRVGKNWSKVFAELPSDLRTDILREVETNTSLVDGKIMVHTRHDGIRSLNKYKEEEAWRRATFYVHPTSNTLQVEKRAGKKEYWKRETAEQKYGIKKIGTNWYAKRHGLWYAATVVARPSPLKTLFGSVPYCDPIFSYGTEVADRELGKNLCFSKSFRQLNTSELRRLNLTNDPA